MNGVIILKKDVITKTVAIHHNEWYNNAQQ